MAALTLVQEKPELPRLAVRLGKCGFAASWGIVFFFHLFNASYTVGMAYLYYYMRRPTMEYYVSLIQMMPQSSFPVITAIYGTISLVNFYHVFTMLVYSVLHQKLVFGARPHARIISSTSNRSPRNSARRKRLWLCIPRTFAIYWRRFIRATSVRGHLFDGKLLVREIVEIASQTYQAHSSSLLVSNVWINQLFGVIVLLNCGANTAVHALQEEQVGMRRFLCTVIDLFLDFAWGFIFPGNIIFYYLPIFVRNRYNLPAEFTASDTLFVKAVLDCRQFFVVSWADMISTVLPYISMLTGLQNLKVLLEIEDVPAHALTATVTPISDGRDDSAPSPQRSHGPSELEIPRRPPTRRSLMSRFRAMHLIPVFGAAVLMTSIAASGAFGHDSCGEGCKLRMHPWFSRHCACSVMEINCHQRKLTGSRQETAQIFQDLDERVLNSLVISHCPAFSMPTDIQRFRNLQVLEFYNVSIKAWSREAALTEPHFPSLKQLYIARSPLGTLPEGLMYETTSSLVDIEISVSDLKSLPDDLDRKWPHVLMFYVEFCELSVFPMVTTRMQLTDLSLIGNRITVFPEDFPKVDDWMYIYFDRNPLRNLPERLGGFPSLMFLSFQNTDVSKFPSWIYDRYDANAAFVVNPFGTPACAAKSDENLPDFLRCNGFNTYIANGAYPLADKDELRRIAPDAPLPSEPKLFV